MEQYWEMKEQYEDEILFFHLGDFYEVFEEDAEIVSRELEITLTSRFQGDDEIAMAGVPLQRAETYIQRLLNKGYRVAICDQVEDSDASSGLVERDVVRVITPGTVTEEEYLAEKQNNYLMSVFMDGDDSALAWTDLSTGSFRLEEVPSSDMMDEISRLDPAEIVVPESFRHREDQLYDSIDNLNEAALTPVPDWQFEEDAAFEALKDHFGTSLLDGYGIQDQTHGVRAAGALLEYLRETQKGELGHIKRIRPYHREETMILDQVSQRSLELTKTIRTGEERGSLVHILDRTSTAMGGRLLRNWLHSPLTNRDRIQQRQEAVETLVADYELRNELTELLTDVYDIERITSKLGSGRANPRDLVSLRQSLESLPSILEALESADGYLKVIQDSIDPLPELRDELEQALVDSPPSVLSDGGIFREGYDDELDELKEMMESGKEWMASFEEQEKRETGIDTLEVGFNKVHGYYIEVTNTHTDKVPERYNRKQTLKNSERYITQDLKEKESQLLNAEERSKELEYELFLELRTHTAEHIDVLQETADAIARTDVLCCLADVAEEKDWVKPDVVEEPVVNIRQGRHPVVEELQDQRFVPNNTDLAVDDDRLLVITGPNMAGKSTYIRQVGLISVLAQMGSFVPARKAEIGIIDRVFTRVGASDELTRGASTFMVEMTETANILNNATERSLVILDEVGRGTSTSDGISIARAVCEHIHDRIGARTLFATHYHELSVLEDELPGVQNYHFGIKEKKGRMVFDRKLIRGASDRSYGIHVAELAGIPDEVVNRARRILDQLEEKSMSAEERRDELSDASEQAQLALFSSPDVKRKAELADEVREHLEDIDVNNITPLDALNLLKKLKDQVISEAEGDVESN
jgi:DNA mismatch repair protein MutS